MKSGLKASHRHNLSGRPTTLDPAHYHDLPEVDAAIAALDGRLDKLEASMTDVILRITKLEAPPVTPPAPPPVEPPPTPPPPTPPPTPTPSSVNYGSAQGDSRDNVHVGLGHKISYRFKATQSSTPTTLRVQQRGGSGYSTGNGGTVRVRVQTDSGGLPSGTVLGELTYSPGNPAGAWEVWTERTFSSASALTAGTVYHLVFDNIAADPVANSSGMNCLYYYGAATTPHQPCFTDDYACLDDSGSGYSLRATDAPIFDLKYANGGHDGLNYIGQMSPQISVAIISGTAKMARERFTVSGGNKTVVSAHVKVKRISGTGDLVIRLENSDGSLIESGSVASSAIPIGLYPWLADDGAHRGGNTWANVTFASSHVLTNGQTYNLRLSTAAGTEYIAVPLQKGDTKGMASMCFKDGYGYRTVDGGSSWTYCYPYFDNAHEDLQFYFVTA